MSNQLRDLHVIRVFGPDAVSKFLLDYFDWASANPVESHSSLRISSYVMRVENKHFAEYKPSYSPQQEERIPLRLPVDRPAYVMHMYVLDAIVEKVVAMYNEKMGSDQGSAKIVSLS